MFIVAIAIMSAIVMWLWNLLIPDLFHGPEVNYWQALGLLMLTRILVGIRGRRGHWWAPWAKRHWKRSWKYRWHGPNDWHQWMPGGEWSPKSEKLSQEEWQAVKNRWKAEFGNRMYDWWKEWEAMSPEERRRYKEEQRQSHEERKQAHREWKARYRGRHGEWQSEYRDGSGQRESEDRDQEKPANGRGEIGSAPSEL